MVLLPDSMTNLSVDSFSCCSKLKHITIPDNVKEITSGVFANSGLIDVVIPDNTVRIKDFAFSDCNDLETIVLPDNIERVSRYAFGEGIEIYTAMKDISKIGHRA
ncbi:Leucine rich repeat-containing protein [Butyrivibrio fibrisolvens]|uniref:Leucine rich repeat-containing protein n=1 Tax=Butyrivibrio fibrisolvens TaxID=831 RepID=A0A1H9TWH6_BUTFI|nr:leucine-rich repeat domain-containing protein [Butyrivibrio fibrisolvens]SES01402.1 Leucine rich repeat-containing protein [Butyrivibrio fibrisolvens]